MNSPIWRSSLCNHRRCANPSLFRIASWRNRSTLSAINRAVRESRDGGRSRRGGRDRPARSATPYGSERSSRNSFRDAKKSVPRSGSTKPEYEARKSFNSASRGSRSSFGRGERDHDQADRSSPRSSGRSSTVAFDRESIRKYEAERATRIASGGLKDPHTKRSSDRNDVSIKSQSDFDMAKTRRARVKDLRPGRRAESNVDVASPKHFESEISPDPSAKHGSGLLRNIKSACRSVETIQERQSEGLGVDNMIDAAKSFLSDVNDYVMSGHFKDEPAEAVASLFLKKAPQGVFEPSKPQSRNRTVIFQKTNGTFDILVGDAILAHRPTQPHTTSERAEHETRLGSEKRLSRGDTFDRKSRSPRAFDRQDEKDEQDSFPVSVPYTTAASEFIYGYNAVLAALRGARRKLYKLYIHPKIVEREAEGRSENDDRPRSRYQERPGHEFVTLAKEIGVPFQNEFKTRLLDTMSGGRPHNGLVLEASKLPVPPVVNLGKFDQRKAIFPLHLGAQSVEEAIVNGIPDSIKAVSGSWRYPLVVMLDGILDEGNLGNIIRTCHFYGVDAIAVAKTCAPLSGVMAKASSGACEAVRILAVNEPSKFVFESANHKWKIYASVAPTENSMGKIRHVTSLDMARDSPLAKHPCILMLGSEGQGLRENLKRRADRFVSINKASRPDDSPDVGLDSLNVTVATGVLLESFLTKPDTAPLKLDASADAELGF